MAPRRLRGALWKLNNLGSSKEAVGASSCPLNLCTEDGASQLPASPSLTPELALVLVRQGECSTGAQLRRSSDVASFVFRWEAEAHRLKR